MKSVYQEIYAIADDRDLLVSFNDMSDWVWENFEENVLNPVYNAIWVNIGSPLNEFIIGQVREI